MSPRSFCWLLGLPPVFTLVQCSPPKSWRQPDIIPVPVKQGAVLGKPYAAKKGWTVPVVAVSARAIQPSLAAEDNEPHTVQMLGLPTRMLPLCVVSVPRSSAGDGGSGSVLRASHTRGPSTVGPVRRGSYVGPVLSSSTISTQWRSPARLMGHYGRERERLDAQPHRGPRSSRYWSIAAREARAVRAFLEQLARHSRTR